MVEAWIKVGGSHIQHIVVPLGMPSHLGVETMSKIMQPPTRSTKWWIYRMCLGSTICSVISGGGVTKCLPGAFYLIFFSRALGPLSAEISRLGPWGIVSVYAVIVEEKSVGADP